MCTAPAELCGLSEFKGRIAVGYDADFCVWNPNAEFTVSPDIIQFQNKANPYMGTKLRGLVYATILRGNHVFQDTEKFDVPLGNLLFDKSRNVAISLGDDEEDEEYFE